MNGLYGAAIELQAFCDARGWTSCFIGGLAVLRWGEPRVTRDVDLALLTGFGGEFPFVDALLAEFPARISDAREFAIRNRVLLLNSSTGVPMDVLLAALPYEEELARRSTTFSFGPEVNIRTCSAEDLIVLKLYASRPLDVQDAEGVAMRQRSLDWDYVESQLKPLAEAKEDPAILKTLARLRR